MDNLNYTGTREDFSGKIVANYLADDAYKMYITESGNLTPHNHSPLFNTEVALVISLHKKLEDGRYAISDNSFFEGRSINEFPVDTEAQDAEMEADKSDYSEEELKNCTDWERDKYGFSRYDDWGNRLYYHVITEAQFVDLIKREVDSYADDLQFSEPD